MNFKKFISLLAAAVLVVVSFAGCSSMKTVQVKAVQM